MTRRAQIEDARERLNRSREIARAIEASLATETARKRGLVEVFPREGCDASPRAACPPNGASASVDASEETLARENEGGGDIDDEKDANGDEETIEGLKRALASSHGARARVASQGETRARAPTSWTPPWTPPSGSGVFFIHVCVYFPYHRSHRARGSSNLLPGADFSSSSKIIACFSTVVPTIATSTRVSRPRPSRATEPTEPNDAQSTPVHRRERVER